MDQVLVFVCAFGSVHCSLLFAAIPQVVKYALQNPAANGDEFTALGVKRAIPPTKVLHFFLCVPLLPDRDFWSFTQICTDRLLGAVHSRATICKYVSFVPQVDGNC